MTVKEKLALVSPTEGQSPPGLPTGWASLATGGLFQVRAASAFGSDTWGLLLPTMTTSYRRLEYTLNDGTRTSGAVYITTPINVVTYSSTTTYVLGLVNGTTTQADVRFNTNTGTVTVRNLNGFTTQVGTVVYAAGTQYRFELSVTIGGNIVFRSFAWGSDTPLETLTVAATSITQLTKAMVGCLAAAAGYSASYGMPVYSDAAVPASTWGTVAPATDPNALATQTFESFTNGGALGLATPWGISGSPAFVGATAAATHGTIGARLTNSTGYSQLEYNVTTSAVRVYENYMTLRTVGNAFICGALFDGSTVKGTWRVNTDRTISIRNASNVVVATSPLALAIGTAYRVAWRIDPTGTQIMRVYKGESTTPLFTLTGACGSGQRTAWRFGVTGASAGNSLDIDTVRVGSDWMAPYGTATTPTTTAPCIFDLGDGHGMDCQPLTGTPTPAPPRALAHIGDSLTADQLSPTLSVLASYQAQGWDNAYIDGEIGRPIVGTVGGTAMETVIDNWRAQSINPINWVIALGSNNIGATDANWVTWIGQALSKIAVVAPPLDENGAQIGSYNVFWPGITFRDDVADSRATRFWAVLQGIVPPTGVTLIPLDLNTALHAVTVASDWQSGDSTGRHMTAAGYTKRNQVLAGLVGAPRPL